MNLDQMPWLLISDVFKGQWTDKVKDLVRESKGKMVPVPSNWTNYFQPLDLTVNKSCKDFSRQEAQSWYTNEIVEQMQQGKKPHEIKVDVRISIVKPLHAKWIVKFYDYIRSNPDLIRNGWRKSGIMENLQREIKLDPFVWCHFQHGFCTLLKLRCWLYLITKLSFMIRFEISPFVTARKLKVARISY